MVDPRLVSNKTGVDEKALMMQMLLEMRDDIKRISASISTQIGIKKSDLDQTAATIQKTIQDNNQKSVEELAKEIVDNYKKERQNEREETQAKLKAGFAIMGEKFGSFSKSIRSTSASALKTFTRPNDKPEDATEAARSVARSAFSGVGKLLAPEKIGKVSKLGQENPEFVEAYRNLQEDIKIASENDTKTQKRIEKMISAMKKQQSIGKYKSDMVNDLATELNHMQVSADDNRKAVKALAKKKTEEYIAKSNKDKKEALAEWQAQKDILKEKSSSFSKFGRSVIGDTLNMFTKQNDKPQDATDAARNLFRKGANYLTQRVKPWLGDSQKDTGQENPYFDTGMKSVAKDIKNDTQEILRRLNSNKDNDNKEFKKEDAKLANLSSSVKKIDRENDDEAEDLTNVKGNLNRLTRYVKNNLVDDIVKELGEHGEAASKKAQADESASAGAEGKGEGEGILDKLGKWKDRLKTLGSFGKKALSMVGRAGKGFGRMALQGGRFALQGARFLGGGSAAGGLAVGALAAASAYTAYQTYKTAKTITENKSNVRESTRGTAEAVQAQNAKELNKDSDEVKASAQRYTKAGLSQDEATATSLAERENSKMLTTAASMGGIFTAAKNSTDFRTSDEEMNKLTEGEVLASTIRGGLDGLRARLQDPASVKNMSPEEAKNLAKQAKITLHQIQDLSNTWDDAKKKATGKFMNSQWLNDKTLVANGDNVVKSLLKSGKDIEKAFDDWAVVLGEGAKRRKDIKDKEKPKTEMKVEEAKKTSTQQSGIESVVNPEKAAGAKDLANKRFDDLDEALSSGKDIKPPPGFKDKNASDTLKSNISTTAENTKPAIKQMSTDIKDSMSEHNKVLATKLDMLNEKLDILSNKKAQAPAAPMRIPPDASFGAIQNMSKGYDS